ncbi:DUF3987 domain-containing protein [Planctomicrobium sp. SH661]|uniref:DUF3987 domain-containing protein n=1 Tax=Planctomicrobium sp. SH661 TaxID=3448124 RepID=UPI003F5C0463
MVALPMLSSLAAAVGNSAVVEVKSTWTEPFVIWTATIAESGSNKSSSLNAGTSFVGEQHDLSIKQNADALHMFEEELAEWERQCSGKRQKPPKPNRPVPRRFQVGDVTTEALIDILTGNPRGVLAKYDELAGLFKSFNQYKGRGGSDVANWLGMFRAEPLTVDRKVNGTVRYIPRAAVSISGTIQPSVLKSCFEGENTENGLASRFLLCRPPESAKCWTDDVVDPRIESDVRNIFQGLYSLPCGERPAPIHFDRDALALFREFVNEHGRETAAVDGHLNQDQYDAGVERAAARRQDAEKEEYENSPAGIMAKEMEEFGERLRESTQTAEEKFADQMAKIGQAFHAGSITADTAKRALEAAQQDLDADRKRIEDEQKRKEKEIRDAQIESINKVADRKRKLAGGVTGDAREKAEDEALRSQYESLNATGNKSEAFDVLSEYVSRLSGRAESLSEDMKENSGERILTSSAREAMMGLGTSGTVDQEILKKSEDNNRELVKMNETMTQLYRELTE